MLSEKSAENPERKDGGNETIFFILYLLLFSPSTPSLARFSYLDVEFEVGGENSNFIFRPKSLLKGSGGRKVGRPEPAGGRSTFCYGQIGIPATRALPLLP